MKKRKDNRRNGHSSSSGGNSSSSQGITMEMRQVALGAVFGAAVAVNATLQSLQESGSFLVQSPSSSSSDISNWCLPPPLPPPVTPRPHKRAFVKVATDVENDQASFFRAFLNEEELDDGGAFQTSEAEERLLTPLSAATTPSSDTSAIVFQEDLSGLESDSLETHQRPRKLQVKRKSMEASFKDKSKGMKGNDEEDSSTEDGDAEWDSSNSLMNIHTSTRKVQRPKFIPLLPQMAQSEEAMSAMLQHTTNTVLETLSEAKERRDQMLENAKKVELPEEQTTLNLMSRFIDALINVSDSLQLVQSALFPSSEGPPTRSQTTVGR
ncbi:unnamed protein product [Calypogeia fissa]